MTATVGSAALDALRARTPLRDIEVVDAHGHCGPYSRFFIPDCGVPAMVRVMDRCGVDVALVASHLALELDVVTGNAETAAAVDEAGGRLRGLVTVNPHDDPEGTLASWVDDPRFVGIKLHPDLHEYPVTGSRYEPTWRVAAERALPVLVHGWAGSPFNDVSMFDTLAERHPDVTLLIGHTGGVRWGFDAAAEVARRHPSVLLEICGTYMTGASIRRLVDLVGADQVVFGSDLPFLDLRHSLGRVLFAQLDDDALRLVLGDAMRGHLHRARPADPAFAPSRPAPGTVR